jgi:hypothetical protein
VAGKLIYAVDGVYPAPSFFTVNSTNGAMTIIKDLREDAKAQALRFLC